MLNLEEELRTVKTQLEETTKEMRKLRNVLGRASATIQLSLQPQSLDPQMSSNSGAVAKRESLLATLLEVMNFDPSPSRQDGKMSSPMFHYTPGDLGFVPAPKSRASNEPLIMGVRTPLPPIASSGTTTIHKQIATNQ